MKSRGHARLGAIATPHHLATEAGAQAFRDGGNALDAALVAAATLTVVYPHQTSIGGDLVALVRSPDGRVRCINATGPAPGGQNAGRLRRRYGDDMPVRGVDAMSVPGAVAGWQALAEFGAVLPWAARLAPAIELAREGVPTARSLAAAVHTNHRDLIADPGCRAAFFPEGRALTGGAVLRQPALSESLAELAAHGPDALYAGRLGSRLVAGLAHLGAVLDDADLHNYGPEVVDPVQVRHHGHQVITSPPNTQGFVLLRALQSLDDAGYGAEALTVHAGDLARILQRANGVRDRLLIDPASAGMTPGAVAEELMRADYDLTEDRPGAATVTRAHGDTVGIVAYDSDGHAVSLIQSLFDAFGAAVAEPNTGIVMQNRASAFSLDPGSARLIAPGKRPPHTLMPVLVTRAGAVRWVSATMGGQAQPQIHLQVLLRALAGASPVEAVASPRWVVGQQNPGDRPDTLQVEVDASPTARQSLRDSGLQIVDLTPRHERVGHANLIEVGAADVQVGSDPRSDGSAVVVDLRTT